MTTTTLQNNNDDIENQNMISNEQKTVNQEQTNDDNDTNTLLANVCKGIWCLVPAVVVFICLGIFCVILFLIFLLTYMIVEKIGDCILRIVYPPQRYWLLRLKRCGFQLIKYAPENIRNDKKFVMAVVQKDGWALKYVSPELKGDKEVVMAAVQKNAMSLQFASPELQNDKQVTLYAMGKNPDAIKFVHENLKRDPDVLIASGMYDEDHDNAIERQQQKQGKSRKIVFSTRFSLTPSSYSEATNFTSLFKNSKYIQEGNFIVYAPNAFDKKTCDPDWTNFDHPCRGTKDTCQYNNILTDSGHPTDECCWRYSFRSQLDEAKKTGGFMLQLVESGKDNSLDKRNAYNDATLGMGQAIELDMAQSLGTKVFQVYRPTDDNKGWFFGAGNEYSFTDYHIYKVTTVISRWYNSKDCHDDMSVAVIRPR